MPLAATATATATASTGRSSSTTTTTTITTTTTTTTTTAIIRDHSSIPSSLSLQERPEPQPAVPPLIDIRAQRLPKG